MKGVCLHAGMVRWQNKALTLKLAYYLGALGHQENGDGGYRVLHAHCARSGAMRQGGAIGRAGRLTPFLGRDMNGKPSQEVCDDNALGGIQGRGGFQVTFCPHQQPDPFQYHLLALEGEFNGGQLSTLFQRLAL
jgi:hypothetical protein